MKAAIKKEKSGKKLEDDTLFGLLSSYKSCNTYFRILNNEKNDCIAVQITDNPKKWLLIQDERYNEYRILKRSDIGTVKLSVKYLSPVHLIEQMGPMLGMKLPEDRVNIINHIDDDGYFILETEAEFLPEIRQCINKIINISPQKKYEILEKSLAKDS